jgi:hypothetical protein
MKIRDTALFSFQRDEYLKQAKMAVEAVFPEIRNSISSVVTDLYRSFIEFYTQFVGDLTKQVVARSVYTPSKQAISAIGRSPNIQPPDIEKIFSVLLDIRTFSQFIHEKKPSKKPLFSKENQKLFEDVCTYEKFGIEKDIDEAATNFFRTVGDHIDFTKKAKLGRITNRLVKHPFHYFCIWGDQDIKDLFVTLEHALVSGGYPSSRFEELIREEALDKVKLENKIKEFKRRRLQEEVKTTTHMNGRAMGLVLEAYDGSFKDPRKHIQDSRAEIDFLKETSRDMEEPKLSGITSHFLESGYRHFNKLGDVDAFKSIETPEKALEWIRVLFGKHEVHSKGSYETGYSLKAKLIAHELMGLWTRARERKELEYKIQQKEKLLAKKIAGVSYAVDMVMDRHGNVIECEFGECKPERLQTKEEKVEVAPTGVQSLESFM